MKKMLTLYVSLLVPVLMLGSPPRATYSVKSNGELIIKGESNLNKFNCSVDRYYRADDLQVIAATGGRYIFLPNRIRIDLNHFDCGSQIMTRDFRQTLKSNENPEIIITFLSIDKLPSESVGTERIRGLIRVTMAGASKDVSINFTTSSSEQGVSTLHGKHRFEFGDFNLEPPTKMMGLIQVKDELDVSFSMYIEDISPTFSSTE